MWGGDEVGRLLAELRLGTTEFRGANQRMNPDFAESAPKAADFADFWPIFPADKV